MRKTILTLASALTLLGFQVSCERRVARTPENAEVSVFHPDRDRLTQVPHVYPYSLIPGGVDGTEEFQAYRAVDMVLATHYRGIGSHLATTTLSRERWLYASYRVSDNIYWTKNRIPVHRGEAVLTDGSNLVRARCGNRLSELPQQPVRRFEPPTVAADLFQPGLPFVPEALPDIPPTPPMGPRLPGLGLSPASPPTVAPPVISTVSLPSTPVGPSIWLPPSTSPASILVPEGHTSVLMLSGLLAVAAVARLAKSKRAS
jgi:hypothetical protein